MKQGLLNGRPPISIFFRHCNNAPKEMISNARLLWSLSYARSVIYASSYHQNPDTWSMPLFPVKQAEELLSRFGRTPHPA